MPRFAGTYDETFTVDVPIERAKAHFGDLDEIGKAYPGLERYEKLDEKTLRFTLNPRNALGQTFRGKYDCVYEFTSDNVLAWRTVGQGANVVTVGHMEFSAAGASRTRVVYHERMECDIPINALLAKAIKPIVDHSIAGGCKEFCANMRARL